MGRGKGKKGWRRSGLQNTNWGKNNNDSDATARWPLGMRGRVLDMRQQEERGKKR
jgi:hypothetical protein